MVTLDVLKDVLYLKLTHDIFQVLETLSNYFQIIDAIFLLDAETLVEYFLLPFYTQLLILLWPDRLFCPL